MSSHQELFNNGNVHSQQARSANITESSILERYKVFLTNHRFTLKLFEDLISRFVLYAPSRFSSHDDNDNGNNNQKKVMNAETVYAFINLWSLFNDSLYYGVGNDNGLTVGILHDQVNDTECSNHPKARPTNKNRSTRNSIITKLRSILSIVECLAPALEVRAYTIANTNTTIEDKTNKRSNSSANNTHLHVLNVLKKIEQAKFICRLSIVLLNYSKCYSKYFQNINKYNDNGNRINMNHLLSVLGILKDGGSFELGKDDSESITTESEIKRVKRLLYVGKRTGRKINDTTGATCTGVVDNVQIEDDVKQRPHTFQNIIQSPTFKISLLTIGEMLHLLRPLYFIHASHFYERRQQSSHTGAKRNENNTLYTRTRFQMLKPWILSFCIDLISCKCTQLGTTVQKQIPQRCSGQTDNRNLSRASVTQTVDISSESTKDELYQRKMRLLLYLLRAPIFDFVTYPLSQSLSKVFSCVPLLGKPVASYLMDILLYWQQWHFMVEQ